MLVNKEKLPTSGPSQPVRAHQDISLRISLTSLTIQLEKIFNNNTQLREIYQSADLTKHISIRIELNIDVCFEDDLKKTILD